MGQQVRKLLVYLTVTLELWMR